MYDKIKAIFVLAAGILLILTGISYKVPALGKFFVKKEISEDPEKMKELGKKTIPLCIVGVFALVLSVLLFLGLF